MINIAEGNKLIAEFMGLPTTKSEVKFTGGFKQTDVHFNYHDQWDWLMSAIQKIKEVDGVGKEHDWKHAHETLKVYHLTIWSDIKTTWNEVVEFIKWYNASITKESLITSH